MLDELAVHNIKIEKIYYCPHGENQCECRKPKPGMILQACKDYNIDLVASYLLGDNHSDIEAANAAGIGNAILYLPKNKLNASVSKHKKIRSLKELKDIIT